MEIFLRLLISILEEGLIYGIMALGVYITYRVLNFPDLSVDGTFPLGACVTGALIASGAHPVAALCASFGCGLLAGLVTGLLHVRLKITDLLSGILVMTGLWSVNLVVLGGKSVLPFYNAPTIFNSGLAALLPEALYRRRVLILLALVVLIVKLAVDAYFRTKNGLLLRATGDNACFVSSLAIDPGRMKVLGLMLGNGLAALSGSVLAQQAESANVSSGTGMVVMGLASVIIGGSLFGRMKFLRPTTAVLLGSIVYKACLVLAMQLGLPTNYLKLLMSAIFVVALVAGRFTEGRKTHA
ncbi:MAG TPA: ABC transporter permease [Candidatus Pullichristensenella excrementigallinarum]|uniref:ABC transporter permease n=1 Tax=Candidatus Pullichristensenella excrementigallinarum TaxID=2840907 RepID=A0A9D1IDC7_9FIRM|nr:ABC transporter permease [Candidatus Pullichristensenella excrementigallinarum]